MGGLQEKIVYDTRKQRSSLNCLIAMNKGARKVASDANRLDPERVRVS
jgi:hypothetical protein